MVDESRGWHVVMRDDRVAIGGTYMRGGRQECGGHRQEGNKSSAGSRKEPLGPRRLRLAPVYQAVYPYGRGSSRP